MTITIDRLATTAQPLVDALAERWSPRAFDETAVITEEQAVALLEAARWAPSASNKQPRRFIAAARGTDEFERILAALVPFNASWARRSSLLIAAVAVTADEDGTAHRWAEYDLGQSAAALTVQAHAEGLHVHQIGGFSPDELAAAFALPETQVPVAVIAVGTVADASILGEPLQQRETAERSRLPLEDVATLAL